MREAGEIFDPKDRYVLVAFDTGGAVACSLRVDPDGCTWAAATFEVVFSQSRNGPFAPVAPSPGTLTSSSPSSGRVDCSWFRYVGIRGVAPETNPQTVRCRANFLD